mmetsp:Transcript_52372/g.159154  ORF Transcript_52372/g.159154 Transcript_52372/m.159154 type:complete len:200 (+) Transcript_52372:1200-1799(+)
MTWKTCTSLLKRTQLEAMVTLKRGSAVAAAARMGSPCTCTNQLRFSGCARLPPTVRTCEAASESKVSILALRLSFAHNTGRENTMSTMPMTNCTIESDICWNQLVVVLVVTGGALAASCKCPRAASGAKKSWNSFPACAPFVCRTWAAPSAAAGERRPHTARRSAGRRRRAICRAASAMPAMRRKTPLENDTGTQLRRT